MYAQVAAMFRLLAHPARLQILDELRRGAACVCHLQTVLQRPQAYVSQQLKVLRDTGMLHASKDGLNVYYALANPKLLAVLETTLGPARPAQPVTNCPCPKCARAS